LPHKEAYRRTNAMQHAQQMTPANTSTGEVAFGVFDTTCVCDSRHAQTSMETPVLSTRADTANRMARETTVLQLERHMRSKVQRICCSMAKAARVRVPTLVLASARRLHACKPLQPGRPALTRSRLSCGRQRTTRHGGADAAPRRGRWQITRTPTGRSMLCSEAPAPRRQLACHRQCQFRQDYQPSCQQRSRIQSCRRHHQSCHLPRLTARHLAHHTKASWLSLKLAQSAKAGTTEKATTT